MSSASGDSSLATSTIKRCFILIVNNNNNQIKSNQKLHLYGVSTKVSNTLK